VDGAVVDAAVGEPLRHTGGCLCGAVKFSAEGLNDLWFCHCRQCRAVTGHFLAVCRTERERFEISGEISWTPHSGTSETGRCASCASPLFWRRAESPNMSVMMGSLDSSEGIVAVGHSFVEEKGDYYSIDDGLPQFTGTPTGGF
jgi:hypothetical protein